MWPYRPLPDPSTALTTLLYSGEHLDPLTALQYLRARYYDLATGRFTRLDPFFGNVNDPQSLHKYLYAHGDPIGAADPSGAFFSLVGATVLQASMKTMKWGAMAGAVLGGIRGAGDAWLDDDRGEFGDVLWGATWGAIHGFLLGGLFGALGPFLGGLHWAIQLTIVGGLSAWGFAGNYGAYRECLAEGDWNEAGWRAGWTLVDGVLGVLSMQGIANIKFGNKPSSYKGGTELPDESTNSLHSLQYATVKWLLAKARVTVMRQPHPETTKPYWVQNWEIAHPGKKLAGAYNPESGEIWLRYDATWYTFIHEVFHVVAHRVQGPRYTRDTGEPAAYNLLRRFFWGFMNAAERKDADLQIS